VAEVTKEFNDKKKEVIQVKQENEKLLGKIAELEKKILFLRKSGVNSEFSCQSSQISVKI